MKSQTQEPDLPLARVESESRVMRPQPTAADMLQAVIQGGITNDNVAALEKITALYERMEDKNAERKFAEAFIQLQQELPTIQGRRGVPDKQGNIKFAYANFDDIDTIVRPICLKHGFSYAFREGGIHDGRVTVIMTLQHSGGHSREIPYSVRMGSGPPGSTESQADVSGHSYAQRGAIESGLSLRVIGNREDARMEGSPITSTQADELEKRVALLNQPHDKFLKWLGVAKYEDIPSSKYNMADDFLTNKERGGK